MLDLSTDESSLIVYEALASKPRLQIIKLLAQRDMNVKELAEQLGCSSATLTMHVKKLEEAGLLVHQSVPGKHGHQKICSLAAESFQGRFRPASSEDVPSRYHHTLAIGHYMDSAIKPTCGLAYSESIIGQVDDPRYFADPGRFQASILWLGSGFVEYHIPNYLLVSQQLTAIEFTLELCSEAPGYNEQWPSDITFSLNGVEIGTWTCPGDFGNNRGLLTPSWWKFGTQHGLLKSIRVTEQGSFLDGVKLSGTTVQDLNVQHRKEISLRIEVREEAKHVGGMVLFGRSFGNYEQDIEVYLYYRG